MQIALENLNMGLVLAVAGILLVIFMGLFGRRSMPYTPQSYLLTDSELRFYKVLRQICPKGMVVMAKVRLADIITCSEADWKRGYGRHIVGKHIDFVLIDQKDSEIRLCIELDDSSHERPERQARDRFVNDAMIAAGVVLLRVPTARHYSTDQLQQDIQQAL